MASVSLDGDLTLDQECLRYAYAAYRRGALPDLPTDLDSFGFTEAIGNASVRVLQNGGRVLAFKATTPRGIIPVGLVGLGDMEPELFWFPEASLRNQIECGLQLLLETEGVVLFWVKAADLPYFRHLARYGSLRAVGKVHGYFQDGDATLFQSVAS